MASLRILKSRIKDLKKQRLELIQSKQSYNELMAMHEASLGAHCGYFSVLPVEIFELMTKFMETIPVNFLLTCKRVYELCTKDRIYKSTFEIACKRKGKCIIINDILTRCRGVFIEKIKPLSELSFHSWGRVLIGNANINGVYAKTGFMNVEIYVPLTSVFSKVFKIHSKVLYIGISVNGSECIMYKSCYYSKSKVSNPEGSSVCNIGNVLATRKNAIIITSNSNNVMIVSVMGKTIIIQGVFKTMCGKRMLVPNSRNLYAVRRYIKLMRKGILNNNPTAWIKKICEITDCNNTNIAIKKMVKIEFGTDIYL